MCGNLPLDDKSDLVRSAYTSPERDMVNMQTSLADRYSVVGVPKDTVIIFDTPSPASVFSKLTTRNTAMLVPTVEAIGEYVICSTSGGLVPTDIVVVDPKYPFPQYFTFGETLDSVSVITRW
jgi:hypothetical protein